MNDEDAIDMVEKKNLAPFTYTELKEYVAKMQTVARSNYT